MRTDAQRLEDVIEATEAIDRFLLGKTLSDFVEDELLQSAVLAKLMIIGEAVCKISPELTAKYQEIPWHKIRGFRNTVVHSYFKIDWDILWMAATKDAHFLRERAREMLSAEFS